MIMRMVRTTLLLLAAFGLAASSVHLASADSAASPPDAVAALPRHIAITAQSFVPFSSLDYRQGSLECAVATGDESMVAVAPLRVGKVITGVTMYVRDAAGSGKNMTVGARIRSSVTGQVVAGLDQRNTVEFPDGEQQIELAFSPATLDRGQSLELYSFQSFGPHNDLCVRGAEIHFT